MIALSSCLRSKVFLPLIALIASVGVVMAQKPDAHITTSQERIAHDQELIRIGEQQHLPPAHQAVLWEQLALEYHVSTEFQKAEDAYLRALHLLKTAPFAKTGICLHTRQPLLALPDLRSFGRCRERQEASNQGAPEAGHAGRHRGERSTPGGHSDHAPSVQEGGATHPAWTATNGILAGPTQGGGPLRVHYADVCTLLSGTLRGRTDERKASGCVCKQELRLRIGGRRVRAGDARVCRMEERGAPGWREKHAAIYPATTDKARPCRSSPGRRPVAIPGLLN